MSLIALNVVIHVFRLALFTQSVESALHGFKSYRHFVPTFAGVVGIAVIFVTGLHIVEAAVWAAAYRITGAIADNKSAMLHPLGALTTYGHDQVSLEARWQMMGALEALNGMLLFGLTTVGSCVRSCVGHTTRPPRCGRVRSHANRPGDQRGGL